ncbi:MAG: dihydropteroate synthase [Myxococcales bacterium]|nr:dihydropteroate synthase [Myxococcales bacterium]
MILIGEKINVGIQAVQWAVAERDASFIDDLIDRQTRAGCHYLDLHAGCGNEPGRRVADDLKWLIDRALIAGQQPLCLDCPDPEILRRAAAHLAGRRRLLLNSLTAAPARLEAMLDLAMAHNAGVIALAMDDQGVPPNVCRRLEMCEQIYRRAADAGLPPDRLYFDAIVQPLTANPEGAAVTLETIASLRRHFPAAETVIGLSNISYGMVKRRTVNRVFAAMAVAHGVGAMILDPTDMALQTVIHTAAQLAGGERRSL